MKSKVLVRLFALLLVLASTAYADGKTSCPPVAVQPTPEMLQNAMQDARDHGFLWRIFKDGHASYLYGTIHVAKFDWMFPGPDVMQALRETDTVALELDMLDPDIQSRMINGLKKLRSAALPAALKRRIRHQAEALCIPFDNLAKLTPEFQITTLTIMEGRWEGLDAEYATDAVLAGIGHKAKKYMVSLETPEAQIQMLQMHNPKETAAFVGDGLDDLASGRARTMFRRIAKVWSESDYDELAHYEEWCDCLNSEVERKEMKRLLDERNPNLADRIDALHTSGKRVFAAVGSLHMFGSLGLPALMEQRGYRVERVDFKAK